MRIGAEFAGNELEPIARSIDSYMERLDGFVEREQSFTATASHELRTPLAVIRGGVELLETQMADRPASANALGRIQRAVREMTEFTDALLTLSREERAAQDSDAGCEIQHLLTRVIDDLRSVTPHKQINVTIEPHAAVRVAAPESMVAMLIGNIVRNALQHGTADDVYCRLQGRELSVSNAGSLPPADPSQPTRRFTTHPGGHGMGLYLVRRICERYRWDIRLENTARGVEARVGF